LGSQAPENFAELTECARALKVTSVPSPSGPKDLDRAIALWLPLMGAVTQTTGEPLWRSDTAVLAIQGSSLPSGGLQNVLSRLMLFVPLGNHSFRYALPGAVCAGLAAVLTLEICHLLFARQGGRSGLDRFLALGVSTALGLSLPWLTEASVAGGAALGAALGLYLLMVSLREKRVRSARGMIIGGVIGAMLTVESVWIAATLGAVLLLSRSWDRHSAQRSPVGLGAVGLGAVPSSLLFLGAWTLACGLLLGPELLESRPSLGWSPQETANSPGLGAWLSNVGLLFSAAAVGGILFGLRNRRPLFALVLLILVDICAPGQIEGAWAYSIAENKGRIALHLVATGAVFALGALGLRTLAASAAALRLFAARPLAALVATLALATCLASAEDTLRTLSQTNTKGTSAFTDAALAPLPPRALVLTKTAAWSRRFLAAQAGGARPDVLIVPLDDLTQARSLQAWLHQEPALETLLRDLSLSETPSESAIALLVDKRPVYLEPNAAWDRRLLEHMLPSIPLAQFSSHAVGRSDRLASLEHFSEADKELRVVFGHELIPDSASLSVYEESLLELLEVFSKIKDGGTGRALLAMMPQGQNESIEGENPLEPEPVAQVSTPTGP
jgi:hypothetical protein